MDSSSSGCLLFLTENLHDIRRLGKEWGFSDETLDRCAEKALSTSLSNQDQSFSLENVKDYLKNIRKTTDTKVLVSVGVLAFVMVTYGALLLAERNQYTMEYLRAFEYQLGRYARFMALPFHRIQKIEDYYNKHCIIDNPLYTEEEPNCDLCKHIKSVKELKVKVPTVKLHLLSYPLMHRGIQKPVELKDIQDLISEHKANLMSQNIECTAKWARHVSDLSVDNLADKISQEEKFSCVWESRSRMFLSQLMRRLFPRPSIIPPDMEVMLEKFVFIDGPGGGERSVPDSTLGGYTWYAQGKGTRVVEFSPLPSCENICPPFQMTVQEGNILTFPSDQWDINLKPNETDITISFAGHVLN